MYDFGKSTFSNFVWIKNGALFSNVEHVEIEMYNAGAYRLDVVDIAGKVLSTGRKKNPNGGWHVFYFNNYGTMKPPPMGGMSPYKLKLVNEGAGERVVTHGTVSY